MKRLIDVRVGGLWACCGILIVLTQCGWAAENQADTAVPVGFVSLFNGEDLTGWKRHEGLPGHDGVCGKWFVEDGAIVGMQDPPGKGGFLTTLSEYKNFELMLETKIDWPFDSGVFLRVGPDGKSHQVTLDYRENGQIGRIYCPWTQAMVHECPDGIQHFKKDEWNQVRIVCRGEPARIQCWLNGVLITDFQHTAETTKGIPTSGTICLQVHPGGEGRDQSQARFRNIYMRELTDESTAGLSAVEAGQGFISLFNGRDLTGWVGDVVGHDVENGVLVSRSAKANLMTAGAYDDFIFRFEFMLTPGANNGLGIRAPLEGIASYQGMEIQILDDTAEKWATLKDWQYHGSIYGVAAAENTKLNPIGQWNTEEVIAQGRHITVRVNGQTVVKRDLEEFITAGTPDGKEHPGLKNTGGHFGFLGHGDVVYFRNIRVKPLAKKETTGQFEPIFNGKDLTGWDGDPRLWSVVDGAIRGQTTYRGQIEDNSFCIWQGKALRNFVLKLKFKIQRGNSGVQYRCYTNGGWRVCGYQAEVCNDEKVGFLYDEGLRGRLAEVGDFVRIGSDDQKEVIGHVCDPKQAFEAYQPQDWNDYTITVRGNHIVHELNGIQTVELIDNGSEYGKCHTRGTIALQIHKGAGMTVDYKDIQIKQLDEPYGPAVMLFNGKDLSGWSFSRDRVVPAWSVQDGLLCNTGEPKGYIQTVEDFTNYVLRLQFRHLKEGNSGVLLRKVGEDKNWPRSIEAQLQSGSVGDIWNIDEFPMTTDPDRTKERRTVKMQPSNEKEIGQWNQYEITLNQGALEIMVNGLVQNTAADCWQTPGKICIQSEGAPMEYRNIVLIPIRYEEK